MTRTGFIALLLLPLLADRAFAQPTESTGAEAGTALVEASLGYTGFGDDGWIHHTAVGGAVRGHVTPRISLAAELSYHVGPGQDRDLMVQGLAYVDLRRPRIGQVGRIEPYVLVGGGIMGHSGDYGSSSSPTVTWGGGSRVWVARRLYLTADARLGWPPNLRVVTSVGVLLR
jgi:hypothetical protein